MAEQLSLNLPGHKLFLVLEKFSFCKLLRLISKLGNVELLFSSFEPLFSNTDSMILLLPLNLDNNKNNRNQVSHPTSQHLTIKLTHIYHKEIPKFQQNSYTFGCVADSIDQFIDDFGQAFETSERFPTEFNLTLTRYLMILAYSIHKAEAENIQDTLTSLLNKLLKKLKGFYDLNQIVMLGSALKCLPIFLSVYEIQEKWVHVFKCKLLENKCDVFRLLSLYTLKDNKEESQALMIKYAYDYAKKLGCTLEKFIDKAASSIHPNLISLLSYVATEIRNSK